MTEPVVTEFNFVREITIGENEPYIYHLGHASDGHKLRVFTFNGNAKTEAIRQLKGMLKCLEDLKDV